METQKTINNLDKLNDEDLLKTILELFSQSKTITIRIENNCNKCLKDVNTKYIKHSKNIKD